MLFTTTAVLAALMAATQVQADFNVGIRHRTRWGDVNTWIIASGDTKCEEVADWYGKAAEISGWTTERKNGDTSLIAYFENGGRPWTTKDLPLENVCGSRALWLHIPEKGPMFWVFDKEDTNEEGTGAIGKCTPLNRDGGRPSCHTGDWFHGHDYQIHVRCEVEGIDC